MAAGSARSRCIRLMSAPKLLLYTHALAGGGAERVCAILAREFRTVGWTVTLAVDRQDDSNQAFLGSGIGMEVLGAGHANGTRRLAALLRHTRPHVSLSLMSASNLKHAAAASLAGRSDRAILSFHAFAASEPQRLSRIGYRSLPVLSRITARTVAVSEGLKRDLVAGCGSAPARTVTIHNPVVVGPDRSHLATEDAPPLILAAGRLVPDKDMVGLVRALAAIGGEPRAHLAILGEGPERGRIEAEVERLGLRGRVHLPGYCPEPWDYYRRAACFVTASRLESFSMVVAEALAYGLPVVACDSPGPREVLADGRFGTLVPPGDTAALACALQHALSTPFDDQAARLQAERFSTAAGVAAYRALFESVMKAASSRAA